jgi:ADP-ribose pyrophosphatase
MVWILFLSKYLEPLGIYKKFETNFFMKKVLKREKVYSNYVNIFKETIFEGSKKINYDVVEVNNGVCVIPMIGDSVILINSYRHPFGGKIVEFVMGSIENENSKKAAARELFEETGYRAKQLTKLGELIDFPGLIRGKMIVFLARNLEKCGDGTNNKDFKVVKMKVNELEELISKNRIKSIPLLAAWHLFLKVKK